LTEDYQNNDSTRSYSVLTRGTAVSHYRIIEKIGAGGMGEIYLAEDTELSRNVALKFLPPHLCQEEECRTRFKREAQATAALNHPNIVTIYEVSSHDNRPFLAMELVEGRTLKEIIRTDKLSFKQILSLAMQISDGLNHAHSKNIIHRDIKPSNIVVDSENFPKILDFGLASVLGRDKITKPGHAPGTSSYMSPEQIKGETVDHRSDIFSFGIVLYEMLSGHHPFLKESESATMNAILSEEPDPIHRYRKELPDELQDIIDKAMDKELELRYQHMDELHSDLKRLQVKFDSGTGSKKSTRYRPGRSPVKHSLRATVVILLAAVVLVMTLSPDGRKTILNWLKIKSIPLEKHLAVLPFTNLGESFPSQTFCDGLMETLTSRLTQMEKFKGALWVVPASEVRQREVVSVKEARRAFGVNLAVTGSVQQLGGNIRLSLNLVDTRSERQLHSTLIDLPFARLIDLQDTTVISMAEMLEIQLRPEERQYLAAGGTDIPEAFGLYLNGRGYLQHYEKIEYIDSAISKFREALDYDNRYALAYAGLGEAFWRKYQFSNEPEWVEQARGNSQIAVSLNDNLVPVYLTLGMISAGTGDYNSAISVYEDALQVDPKNYRVILGLADTYDALEMAQEAENYYTKLIKVRPKYWAGYFDLSYFYTRRSQPEKAMELLNEASRLVPHNARDLNDIGGLFLMLGYFDDARIILQRSIDIEPTYGAFSNLGYIFYIDRQYEDAARMYEKALSISDHDYKIWNNLASAYYYNPGQRPKAIETYERAIEETEKQLQVSPRDPDLLISLAQFYGIVGDTVRALDLIMDVIDLKPGDADVKVSIVFAFHQIGQDASALVWLKKVIEQGYPVNRLETLPEMKDLMKNPQIRELIEKNKIDSQDNGSSSY